MLKAFKGLFSRKPATTFYELEGTRHDGTKTYSKFFFLDAKAAPPDGFDDKQSYTWYDAANNRISCTYGSCEGNLLHGKMAMAYTTGRVYMECGFYYGLDHGITSMWDDDGQLFYQVEYHHGALVKTIIDNRPME